MASWRAMVPGGHPSALLRRWISASSSADTVIGFLPLCAGLNDKHRDHGVACAAGDANDEVEASRAEPSE